MVTGQPTVAKGIVLCWLTPHQQGHDTVCRAIRLPKITNAIIGLYGNNVDDFNVGMDDTLYDKSSVQAPCTGCLVCALS